MNRRRFLSTGSMAGAAILLGARCGSRGEAPPGVERVIATYPSGVPAGEVALEILQAGGSALDAVERGVMVAEANPEDTSVGYGGYPNADGVVQLDAAIMNGTNLDAGSVAGVRGILHPTAVARRVMEDTPHVLLVGEGAERFAHQHGFEEQDLLTPGARQAWEEWRASGESRDPGHDTMGMVAIARDGTMAAACTTSGIAWKLPGRVGDSPLIGHGLYCDDEAGGAAATGIGEEIIKVCGSYQVVEFMRQGLEPVEAIRRVLERIVRRNPANREEFIGFVALRADGEVGYLSTTPGFQAAVSAGSRMDLRDSEQL